MIMKYIRTPTGEVFQYNECEIFDDDFCEITEVFSNTEKQKELANEMFEQTGILVADVKGGENCG